MSSTNESSPVRIGRYEVVFTVAAGAPSSLFVARLDELETATGALTIRRISPDVTRGNDLDTFLDSARQTLGLDHPNIVTVREVVSEPGETFLVMDLLDGESTAALIHRIELDGGSLGYGLAAHVVAEAAAGLDAAHERGLLHGHLTPSDVFVGHDGSVRVLDIGIARSLDRLTGDTTVSERDLPYAAPERCKGDPLDRRCDVFSLGALLWELMTGISPFEGATPADTLRAVIGEEPKVPSAHVLRNLPNALSEIAFRALARDRADRYPTARALAVDLAAFVKDFPFGGARPAEPLATLMQRLFAKRMKHNARLLRRVESARMSARPRAIEVEPQSTVPSRADLEKPTVQAFVPVALPLAKPAAPATPVEPPPVSTAPPIRDGEATAPRKRSALPFLIVAIVIVAAAIVGALRAVR